METLDGVIRVMVVDDHDMIRRGLEAMLHVYPDLAHVGSASSGDQVVALCQQTHPDVILMDLVMPGMSGVEATRAVRAARQEAKVLVLTNYDEANLVQAALEAGACGYLLKNISVEELAEAIRKAHAGQVVLAAEATSALIRVVTEPEHANYHLTKREHEVLALMVEGLNNREIADRLAISQHTAKNHVSSLLAKLGASSRTEAAILAMELELVRKPTGEVG